MVAYYGDSGLCPVCLDHRYNWIDGSSCINQELYHDNLLDIANLRDSIS